MATQQTTKNREIEVREVTPLPFNEVLQKQSLQYWRVARAWNGVANESISVGEAFDVLNGVLNECNPQRPLAFRINMLRSDIVEYGSKKKRKAANANLKPAITVL